MTRKTEITARLNFPLKRDKVLECILYLTGQGLDLTSYRVVKLLYLADREHLRRFGRPISFDRYVAMENGPVASHALDIMTRNPSCGVDFERLPFTILTRGKYQYAESPNRAVNRKLFSKSDFIILDETCQKYGNWNFGQLYDETHRHEAYNRIWENRKTMADPMMFEDFFEGMENQEDIIKQLEPVASNFRK